MLKFQNIKCFLFYLLNVKTWSIICSFLNLNLAISQWEILFNVGNFSHFSRRRIFFIFTSKMRIYCFWCFGKSTFLDLIGGKSVLGMTNNLPFTVFRGIDELISFCAGSAVTDRALILKSSVFYVFVLKISLVVGLFFKFVKFSIF